jgi:membrane protein YqaA with SNARE-associated domain
MAYLTLFVVSFLAATLIPLPSELQLVVVVRTTGEVAAPLAVATLGNYLGACTTYVLARGLLASRLRRRAEAHPRAVAFFERYGAVTLLFSWVPIIGDGLVAIAGAVPVGFVRFSAFTIAGKGLRYAFVVWATRSV